MIKKKGFLFLVVLVLLPSVFALDLGNIPVLLLVPLILISIVVIIFVVIIVKDKLAAKSLAMPTFNNVGKKEPKEEKKPEEEEKKEEVNYYGKIEKLEQKLKEIGVEAIHKEFITMVRDFFSNYLGLNYQFTYGELERELKKQKKKTFIASNELSRMEYGPGKISREELLKMVGEFKILLRNIQSYSEVSEDSAENVKKIRDLVDEGKKMSKRDLVKAMDIYKRIYFLYYKLPKENRIELYDPIIKFYRLIS